MNFNQLAYFIEIKKKGSFSKAADSLHITQPALSLQIQKLEENLEFKLLDRSRKPLQLTPEGELFVEKASEIIKLTNQLKDLGSELGKKIKGQLSIGIIPTLAPYFIPLFIDQVNTQYPDLKITISEIITEDIIEGLKSGSLDAGILSTPITVNNIHFQTLFFEQFFLYVSEKHPLYVKEEIDMDDFSMDDLWYLQEGNCFQNQVNAICQLPDSGLINQNLEYRSNSIESLRRIVESRKGMTFIPELATINIPGEFEDLIKPIKDITPYREISLAVSRLYTKKRLIDKFIEVAMSNIPKRMKEKPSGKIIDTSINIKK